MMDVVTRILLQGRAAGHPAIYDLAGENLGITENGDGSISNAGLLETSRGITGFAGAILDNTGTILAAVQSDLLLSGGGDIAGALTGTGEIAFDGGNFSLASAAAINVATLGF